VLYLRSDLCGRAAGYLQGSLLPLIQFECIYEDDGSEMNGRHGYRGTDRNLRSTLHWSILSGALGRVDLPWVIAPMYTGAGNVQAFSRRQFFRSPLPCARMGRQRLWSHEPREKTNAGSLFWTPDGDAQYSDDE